MFDEPFVETISGNQNADLLGEVYGQVYLDDGTCCNSGPFEPPRLAAWETFTYKAKEQYDVSIRFVIDRHVEVMLPREFVTCEELRPVSESFSRPTAS